MFRLRTKIASLEWTSWLKRAVLGIGIALTASSSAQSQSLVSPQFDAAVVAVQRAPSAEQWLKLAYYLRHSDAMHYVEDDRRYFDSSTDLILVHLLLKSGAFSVGGFFARYECPMNPTMIARYPGDFIAIFDLCMSSGSIDTKDPYFTTYKQQVDAARIESLSYKAELPAYAAKARGSGDGIKLANVGNVYLTFGDPVMAEKIYLEVLQKNPKDRDLVLLELGMAQFDQGRFSDAEATLLQVVGRREPLARLWRALIATRR